VAQDGEASSDDLVVDETVSDYENLIEATPVESVAVQLGQKRRKRETIGSSD
jgi:hypothetical protein